MKKLILASVSGIALMGLAACSDTDNTTTQAVPDAPMAQPEAPTVPVQPAPAPAQPAPVQPAPPAGDPVD